MTTLTLQMLCLAGFVISVVLAGYVMNTVGSFDDLTGRSSYEETSGCGMDAAQELHQNTQHVGYKPWFETDGEYNENKKIDISDPGRTDAGKMDKNTTYTVGLAEKYSESGPTKTAWGFKLFYPTGDINMIRIITVKSIMTKWILYRRCVEAASEEGTAETRLTDEENYILREMYNAGRESKWNFLPPEYPLADQALKEQSVLYLMQKYENMSKVLDGLGIYLSSRNIDLETNLKYYVRDTETGAIATNVQGVGRENDRHVRRRLGAAHALYP